MMPRRLKTDTATLERPNWREYQDGLKWSAAKKRFFKGILKCFVLAFLLFIVAYRITSGLGEKSIPRLATDYFPPFNPGRSVDKKTVQTLLNHASFVNLKDKSFDFISNDHKFRVETSLNIGLQNYLLSKLNTSTARYIGIVAMDPATGKILSMVSFNKTDPSNNPCLDNRFPAASIFKIVTASAAIEKYGFSSNHIFTYNGMKHTLYKSQLKERKSRYTNRITFKDAFAQSVNPVFGKIGSLYLGKDTLEEYAKAFGFNKNIDFEIMIDPSCVALSDEPYQWAEIASGFNNKTKMSPIHGAMMASAIINQGQLLEPTIVDRIVNEKGRIIYNGKLVPMSQAMAPNASQTLNRLMANTIKSGTGRKAFRRFRKDKILSRLNIGGKTGSIDNKTHDARYDWFVGFAEEKEGEKKIALSVIVAHEKYIGLRATYYARIAMKKYFEDAFAKNQNLAKKKAG
ncbi:MAG: penicillin-binding transpeptidase domain-containing protein [Desulfobacteraceae bacterium]|nr:penicillin-binding transpeptidase domain-containing protein [Desulfobacteraceae bacterium]